MDIYGCKTSRHGRLTIFQFSPFGDIGYAAEKFPDIIYFYEESE